MDADKFLCCRGQIHLNKTAIVIFQIYTQFLLFLYSFSLPLAPPFSFSFLLCFRSDSTQFFASHGKCNYLGLLFLVCFANLNCTNVLLRRLRINLSPMIVIRIIYEKWKLNYKSKVMSIVIKVCLWLYRV